MDDQGFVSRDDSWFFREREALQDATFDEEWVPEDRSWPPEIRARQQTCFEYGYRAIRYLFKDAIAGSLDSVDSCLPYFLSPEDARALARITLAVEDPRTPGDVREMLERHRRDLLRGQKLLYHARPLAQTVRITPEVRRAFPRLYHDLLTACQTSPRLQLKEVLAIFKHVNCPDSPEIRQGLDEVLASGNTPHVKAKEFLQQLFGISEGYVRRLSYVTKRSGG